MAMAVQKLYPDAKVTIGPWIESGFYYDFDMEPVTDKDLKKIKKEMVSRLNITIVPFAFNMYYGMLGYEETFISICLFGTEFIRVSSVGSHHW